MGLASFLNLRKGNYQLSHEQTFFLRTGGAIIHCQIGINFRIFEIQIQKIGT